MKRKNTCQCVRGLLHVPTPPRVTYNYLFMHAYTVFVFFDQTFHWWLSRSCNWSPMGIILWVVSELNRVWIISSKISAFPLFPDAWSTTSLSWPPFANEGREKIIRIETLGLMVHCGCVAYIHHDARLSCSWGPLQPCLVCFKFLLPHYVTFFFSVFLINRHL